MKIDIPEKKKLIHELVIPVRWGDMDAMNHVNNTAYFRYMETVRIDWICRSGASMDPQGQGIVLINAFCNFYRQLEYPGNILAKLYASDPGSSSFETWVTIEREDSPGLLNAAGGATTVWVDYQAQRSRPLPDWLRALVS